MNNRDIANSLYEIANLLEIEGVAFKPRAYREVARNIDMMAKDLAFLYHKNGEKVLEALPGVGKSIAKKIIEIIDTGELEYLKKLRKKIPVDVMGLTRVQGVGPKTVKKLYEELGIKNLEDLENAARNKMIRGLPGFKERSEEKILESIEFFKKNKGRRPYAEMKKQAEDIAEKLKNSGSVEKIKIVGSLRRKEERVKDIDILVVSKKPQELMELFCNLPQVIYVHGKGTTKASVKLKNGIDADLRVVPEESWGGALQYFTGDIAHNVKLRKIAKSKGLKLNEYGVFKGNKKIDDGTEEGVYRILGLDWLHPEKRKSLKSSNSALGLPFQK